MEGDTLKVQRGIIFASQSHFRSSSQTKQFTYPNMYNALVFNVLPRSYEGLCKSNIRNLLFSKESPTSRLSSTLATIQIFGFPYTGSYTL